VELFFKWVKQHLRIKRFYGTSENAVKTQVWIWGASQDQSCLACQNQSTELSASSRHRAPPAI
jgi:hypothetical protein